MKESFKRIGRFLTNALVPAMLICSGVQHWVESKGSLWCLFGYAFVLLGVMDIYAVIEKSKANIERDVDISKREINQLFKMMDDDDSEWTIEDE